MVWEANDMPVIDPRKLSKMEKEKINDAFKRLLEECRCSNEKQTLKLRYELNLAVMSALGLENRTKELEDEVQNLIEVRVGGGGAQKNIMVEHEGEAKEIKLKGARVVSQGNSLDRYL
jgi:hypothetical protein